MSQTEFVDCGNDLLSGFGGQLDDDLLGDALQFERPGDVIPDETAVGTGIPEHRGVEVLPELYVLHV